MSEEIIRVLPGYYVIFSFMTGLFIVLLSPLHLFLPRSFNPFVQDLPSETLGSIAVFAITSLMVGIPGVLFRNSIVAKKGINERFFDYLKKDFIMFLLRANKRLQSNLNKINKNHMVTSIVKLVNKPFTLIERQFCSKFKDTISYNKKESFSNANYAIWVAKSGIGGYLSILNLREGIISGIIIGTELAFLFNILAIPIFLFTGLPTHGIPTLIIYSFTCFFLICLVNKFWFRDNLTEAIKDVNKQYEENVPKLEAYRKK